MKKALSFHKYIYQHCNTNDKLSQKIRKHLWKAMMLCCDIEGNNEEITSEANIYLAKVAKEKKIKLDWDDLKTPKAYLGKSK